MSQSDLLKIVTSLGSPTVLLVGDFMLDMYVYGDALRISPEAPVQILKVVSRDYACGGAASVAADVLALGARCRCIGITGNDDNGRTLRSLLEKQGADISGLITLQDRPTITKQRVIGLAQHRHRQQLLRIDDEITEPLQSSDSKRLLDSYKHSLAQSDIVCLQDYNKGILQRDFCQELIQLAKQAGKKVLVDPPLHEDYSKFTGATLITPNRKETSVASGIVISSMDAAKQAAVKLFNQLSLDAAVITLDKEGAYLHTKNLSEQIPTQPRTVYDVTGAGDMMLAAIAVALAAGCDYKTAVQLSNIAAGLEVEKFGVATITIDEIVNEIIASRKGKAGKIREIPSLVDELEYYRRSGQKIVFTNGCFDVLHIGHIEYLKFCKTHGDIVVIGLNSDSSVRQIKGPTRPINNQHERAAVLAALECVDYVTFFEQPDPLELIKQVKPDILIKGTDWAEKGVIGREFVESHGGKVVLSPMVEGKSTTSTIEKMRQH
jgi:D-beta-D-heptose 7-phosphate kinase/D-beta-D-heptose 1-phosphate adenosyltransferase